MMLFDKIRPAVAAVVLPIFLLLVLASLSAILLVTLPEVSDMKGCLTTSMNQVELCPTGKNYVKLANISPVLIHAIIASEDASFYNHEGFDWFEIRESFNTNLKRGRMARGGSTITQQLVKNVFLGGEKSLVRKAREALLTKQVEERFSKQEILERYLNVVELGPNIFGIKKASAYYFSKAPIDLNLLEAAYLAFLLPNPSLHYVYYEQNSLTDYARKRLLGICLRLYRFNKISRNDLEIANFRVLEFPWKNLRWEKSELMDAVNDLLEEETGDPNSSFPVIEEDLPATDPEFETPPATSSDSPWDESGSEDMPQGHEPEDAIPTEESEDEAQTAPLEISPDLIEEGLRDTDDEIYENN